MDLKEAAVSLVSSTAAVIMAILTLAGIIAKIKPVGRSIKQLVIENYIISYQNH
jgi:hypothetical protein